MNLGTTVRSAALLAALILLPGMAAACCTSILCPYCISSSDKCIVCAAGAPVGSEMPVCNVFGCNCNNQCGAYTASTNGQCYFSTPCDSDAAKVDAQARFNEVDGNRDGGISREEAWAWAQKQKSPLSADVGVLPAGLKDGDGQQREIAGFGFSKADADGDGSISPAEFDGSLAAPAKM